MVKRIARYAWSARHEFAKYTFVGCSGFVLDIGLLILFKEVFLLTATLAVILEQIVVLIYNFTLNKYWSFRNRAMPHKQLVRYLILAGWNYVFGVIMMYIFSDGMGYDYRFVRIVSVVIAVMWNFILYKHWVYADHPPSVDISATVEIKEKR